MERGESLHFWNNKYFLLLIFGLGFAGCATSASKLPPDCFSVAAQQRVSVDDFDVETSNLTCEQIDVELKILENKGTIHLQDIEEKRVQNQVAGYLGSIFILPALLATDNSSEAKAKIEKIQQAKDLLYKLRAYKKCH